MTKIQTSSSHASKSAQAPQHSGGKKSVDQKHGHHGHSSFTAAKGKHHGSKQVDPAQQKLEHSLHGKSVEELQQLRDNQQIAYDAYLAMTPPNLKKAQEVQSKMDAIDDAIALRTARDPSLSVDAFKTAIDGMGKASLEKLQKRLQAQPSDNAEKLAALKSELGERVIDSKKSTPDELRQAAKDLSPEALEAKTAEVRAKYDAMVEKMKDPSFALAHQDRFEKLARKLRVLENAAGTASAPVSGTTPPAATDPGDGAVDPAAPTPAG
jgi:hypothetical protein